MGEAVTITPDQPQVTITPDAAPEHPGILDRQIPLTSYGNATLAGAQSIGRGIRDAVIGFGRGISHPIATAQGLAELPAQAAQVPAAVSDINKSADPVGTYANVVQNTAGQGAGQALTVLGAEGLARGATAAKDALPSAASARSVFQNLKSTVGDVPINTAKVGDAALELYEQSQRGATLPSSVGKLVRRLTAPDAPPLTYAEAKDFQSNISDLSTNEKMNLKANTVRLVGQLNQELKSALADAADTQGKGAQFMQAMKEYHQAMKLKGYSDDVINAAWQTALRGAGVYGAAKIFGLADPRGH